MFLFITTSCYLIIATLTVDCRIVSTTTGPVRGKLNNDESLYYYSYQGIPYAETPTGSLRFVPPVPKTPWSEELDATKEGPVCPQSESYYKRDQMSEDCLFLNIYVPANCTGLLPVYAFVHGGKFIELSGNTDIIFGPQLLLKRDVIFATMNYRLGALGFLSLETEDASGNTGIKDVLLALKWIKTNVDRFGGDPNQITLGGWSAGAGLAHYLLLSTKSTGLFQRAVLESGSALSYRFLALHPKENALALAQELNLEATDTTDLLNKLKDVDAFDIVEAQKKMGENNSRNGFRPFNAFPPCIEIESSEAVITKHPIEIITSGIPQNIPILVGINTQEGIMMLPDINKDQTLVDNLNENFELCIPSNIEYPYGSYESRELARWIRQFYFNGANITNCTLNNFVDLVRDTQFFYPTDWWIKLHKKREDSNVVYYYVFDFDGELNWFKIYNKIDFPGSSHGDNLGYIYKTNATKQKLKHLDSRNRRTVETILSLLTDFIKLGNPTPEGYGVDDLMWPDCGVQRNHLLVNDDSQIIYSAPFPNNSDFWYNVYDQYYEYLLNGGSLAQKNIP